MLSIMLCDTPEHCPLPVQLDMRKRIKGNFAESTEDIAEESEPSR